MLNKSSIKKSPQSSLSAAPLQELVIVTTVFCLSVSTPVLAQVIGTQTTTINPLGYAYVRSDGSVDPARSRNVTSANVVRNGSGVYGFRNLSFIPRNIQITLAFRTQAVTNDARGWETRRDMNATTYSNWWKTYRDEGYRLVDFEVYPTTQGTRYAGGGLESSSVDLARFGMKILDGSFLSTQALNELGWQGGARSFLGSQNGANSNLRLYPNSNLVIAILSNQNGHNPEELGQTLGEIVLKAE